jgi:hypothetical protein
MRDRELVRVRDGHRPQQLAGDRSTAESTVDHVVGDIHDAAVLRKTPACGGRVRARRPLTEGVSVCVSITPTLFVPNTP